MGSPPSLESGPRSSSRLNRLQASAVIAFVTATIWMLLAFFSRVDCNLSYSVRRLSEEAYNAIIRPSAGTLLSLPTGTHALYTVSTYSFDSHTKTNEIRLFDIEREKSTLITNEKSATQPHWLGDDILYL